MSDAAKATEVLVCISCESRSELEELAVKAVANGANAPRALEDHGFMLQHGFHDLDGHAWELIWTKPTA